MKHFQIGTSTVHLVRCKLSHFLRRVSAPAFPRILLQHAEMPYRQPEHQPVVVGVIIFVILAAALILSSTLQGGEAYIFPTAGAVNISTNFAAAARLVNGQRPTSSFVTIGWF